MGIEIRQLVVKTSVDDTRDSEHSIELIIESLRKEIMRECRDMIEKNSPRKR